MIPAKSRVFGAKTQARFAGLEAQKDAQQSGKSWWRPGEEADGDGTCFFLDEHPSLDRFFFDVHQKWGLDV